MGQMKTTDPITYRYELDGHKILLTRIHTHTAYARNGNVGNPKEYFVWDTKLDGKIVARRSRSRADAYEYARAHVLDIDFHPGDHEGRGYRNVRRWTIVRDEMKANYRGQERSKETSND
jgi:hypothetical protein